jgi:hypothetical protein
MKLEIFNGKLFVYLKLISSIASNRHRANESCLLAISVCFVFFFIH